MAATSQSEGLQTKQAPVTTSDLLPPYIPCPRAWERVLVAPAASHGRQRKIWKRVAGPFPGAPDVAYRHTVAELDSQGSGSRKRARLESHIPVWGDVRWNAGVDQPRDGKQDLAKARAALIPVGKASPSPDFATTTSRHATFPEERLRWVPRKRHNSRSPIEAKASTKHMVAVSQPLLEFEVPATAELVDVTQPVDEKQLEKRSTRRLSRRLSLFPGEFSPRKLSAIALSPAKMSASALSPVKRPPVVLSPKKVAESPLRAFRVNATPSKVVLESPEPGLPHESPLKSSPSSVAQTPAQGMDVVRGIISASPLSNYCPLIFDQPNLETSSEPQYEVQRRRSLQSARRNDRSSIGVSRVIHFECAGNPPKRRHSFGSVKALLGGTKERRRTFDAFGVVREEADSLTVSSAGSHEAAEYDSDQRVGEAAPYPVVKVDAGTNIDIFGTSQAAGMDGQAESTTATPSRQATTEDLGCATAFTGTTGTPSITFSPVRNILGVVCNAPHGELLLDQAATPLSPCTPKADSSDMDVEPSSCPAIVEESPIYDTASAQDEFGFEHQDPEGLSTIYEESFVLESEEANMAMPEPPVVEPCTETPAIKAQPTADVGTDDTTQRGEEEAENECISGNGLGHPDNGAKVQMKPSIEEPALASHTPAVLTNHVVTTIDGLANRDSPRFDEEPITQPSDIPQLDKTEEGTDSASPSEESVGTPENDFYVTATFGIESQDYDNDTTSMEPPTSIRTPSSLPEADADETDVSPTALSKSDLSPQPIIMTPELPGTPGQLAPQASLQDAASPTAVSPKSESSGFTPINARQISPPRIAKESAVDEGDSETETGDLDSENGDDVMMDAEDEITEAIDDDLTLNVVAPNIENDTLNLQAMHDDSETEMLRKFVTRVAADRNAKAAAAAAALATKSARSKRRSGSMGSTASSTGSPIAKSETPMKRTPLGEKSANSPSPVKKRKLHNELGKDKDDSLELSEDSIEGPKLKRRRKRMDPVLNTVPDGAASLESDVVASESGPRRSTRSRSARVALKPAAPSANSIALSLIPVRLPGMAGMMDDAMLESNLAVAKNRSDEKDVAAVTRVNTRKNKGGSVPPKLVLARQAEDPAAWRMKELKGVFDAKESRAAGAKDESAADGRKSRKVKGVRWAEELVRFQGDEAPSVFRSLASSLLADIMGETADEADKPAPPEHPAKEEPVEKHVATPAKKAQPRRTRSSRLQAPTPVQKLVEKTAPSVAPPAHSTALSKTAVAIASVASTAAPSTRASTGIATRRSKIAKLGMGVNGTPAPKRRGKTVL